MDKNLRSLVAAYERRIELLTLYRQMSRQTIAAMIDCNLDELERCLDGENALITELKGIETFAAPPQLESNDSRRVSELRSSLRLLLQEITNLSEKKSAVLVNGRDFASTMLNIICPPLTYEELATDSGVSASVPPEAVISIRG